MTNGEWAQMSPAEVARSDEVRAARDTAETARQEMLTSAETRRQAMIAGDMPRATEAGARYREMRDAHSSSQLIYTDLARQARLNEAEAEAGL